MTAALFFNSGCGITRARQSPPAGPPSPVQFTRINDQAGVDFLHEDGSSGRKYFAEVMGPGCAFADFTGDGRADLYLVNGARFPGAPAGPAHRDRFYRNRGDGTFTEATQAAGLGDERYGIGCAAGDFDNDGDLDLYVTNLTRNTLYQNNGDGSFTDVTARAGVGAGGFSTAASFGDFDKDGHLDLYVCRYVDWSPETNIVCTEHDGSTPVQVYCRPTVYRPLPDLLYRNNGDGSFTEVTRAAGMAVTPGRGLGCIWSDLDEDGDLDLYVTNDMSANFLFINQGRGRFTEEALSRGVSMSDSGRPMASMGVAVVDYDGDTHLDLACTNFSGEYLALYRNRGDGQFEDVSSRSGLVDATGPFVGFGLAFPDLNRDGYPDLLVVNGEVTEASERFYPGTTLAQPSLCLLNLGSGTFEPVKTPGRALTTPRVSRGLALADFDTDGDLDALVSNWRGEPDLLRNDSPSGGSWLRLTLAARAGNRHAIGARVEVLAGGKSQAREVHSGGSYCSQHELPLTFGLGKSLTATVRVRWPDGRSQTWTDLSANQEHLLQQQ